MLDIRGAKQPQDALLVVQATTQMNALIKKFLCALVQGLSTPKHVLRVSSNSLIAPKVHGEGEGVELFGL